jgi:hypothetical protein
VAEGILRRLAAGRTDDGWAEKGRESGGPAGGGWGAIKYTKTAFYTSVTDASETASQENKDSTRLLKAGAARCLWLQAPPHELSGALSMAMDNMSGLDGVIVEGNAPLDCMDFDAVIFVFGPDAARFKDGAEKALAAADIVVFAGVSDAPETGHMTGRAIRGGIFCAPSLSNSEGDNRRGGSSGGVADARAELDAIYTALAGILELEGGGCDDSY